MMNDWKEKQLVRLWQSFGLEFGALLVGAALLPLTLWMFEVELNVWIQIFLGLLYALSLLSVAVIVPLITLRSHFMSVPFLTQAFASSSAAND